MSQHSDMLEQKWNRLLTRPIFPGPKIYLILPIVIGLLKVPMRNMGNMGNICAFTLAWKHFRLEVSGLIHQYNNHMTIQLTLTPSSTTSALVLLFMINFNTAQLRFYHCPL